MSSEISDSTQSRSSVDDRPPTNRNARIESQESHQAAGEDIKNGNGTKKLDKLSGLNERILHFSPSWFSVTMGTGIPTTLLLNLPYSSFVPRLRPFAAFFLILDIILFSIFTFTILIRYFRYPGIFRHTLSHPVQSMFLGTIPMSMITLISGVVAITQAYDMGEGWVWAMSYCWWFTLVVVALCAILVPYIAFTIHQTLLETSTAVLLLPVVPAITGSAIGAVISSHLMVSAPNYAFQIWVGSYVLLGCGLPLALGILTLYLQRLLLHHIPAQEMIVSSFLPLGPTGLAGFSLVKLGKNSLYLIPAAYHGQNTDFENVGAGMYGGGIVGALLLWGLGIWFLFIALASFAQRWREGVLRFNMGWWGLTFPLASLTLSTLILGQELSSTAFNVIGTAFTICVILFWAMVTLLTSKGVLQGSRTVFAAPCLSNWAGVASAKGTPVPVRVLA